MSFLYLLRNRLRQYFIKNKAVFIVFMIGSIFAALMITYFYGNVVEKEPEYEYPEYWYRQYELTFRTPMRPESYDSDFNLLPLLGKYNGELNDPRLIESVMVEHELEFSMARRVCLTACAWGDPKIEAYEGSGRFTGEFQLLAPKGMNKAVGDSINIEGFDFVVIGLYDKPTDIDWSYNYITDMDTFLKTGLSHDEMYLYSLKAYAEDAEDPVEELIKETYGCGVKGLYRLKTVVSQDELKIEIAQMTVCYLVSSVSFMFLMVYMIDSLKKESVISMIVGATKGKLRALTLTEVFILTSVSSLIAIFLHKLLYDSFFSNINLREGIVYKAGDYLKVYALMLIISIAVEIPFVFRYTRITPAEARRRRMP